jgi:TolB-like protein
MLEKRLFFPLDVAPDREISVRFAFGAHVLDADRRELSRGGEPVALEPQVFDVIVHLLRNRDRVVGKDDLIARIWQGRAVSDSTVNARINAARTAVGDSGAEQRVIRTIARRGFRFVAEVTEHASPDTSPPAARSPAAAVPGAAQPAVLALPDKPSIAVLPFQNLGTGPEQDYFADGMVEEITTALARINWLFVIARNSSFTYQGQAVDVRRVGRELGVRYVLEGSVRRAGDRVRITAQLIAAEDATHLWAERFDGSLDGVFELQDRIAASVAGAIEPKLLHAEMARAGRKPTESLDAYDLYLRALARFHDYSAASLAAAAALAKQALAADPQYARAAALAAFCRAAGATMAVTAMPPEEIAEATRFATLAIDRARDDPEAVWMAAYTLALFSGDHAAAVRAVDRALSQNPNSAFAWSVRGWSLAMNDDAAAATESFQRAMRLSPFDPLGWISLNGLAFAALTARRFEDAVVWADRTLDSHARYAVALRIKAIALAHLGRLDEAGDCARAFLAAQPGFTLSGWTANYAAKAFSAGTLALFRDGLRLAGAPE